MYRFRGKVPEYYAAAAGWLGEPATKDKVEKGERFFRQVIGRTAETQRVLLHLLIDTIAELDRLDREAKQESANQASRRKAARYASFSART